MNRLNLKTYSDEQGPLMYTLTGEMTDEDGQSFSIGEASANYDRIMRSVTYYLENYTPIRFSHSSEFNSLKALS
jgi:hypothetical protein